MCVAAPCWDPRGVVDRRDACPGSHPYLGAPFAFAGCPKRLEAGLEIEGAQLTFRWLPEAGGGALVGGLAFWGRISLASTSTIAVGALDFGGGAFVGGCFDIIGGGGLVAAAA